MTILYRGILTHADGGKQYFIAEPSQAAVENPRVLIVELIERYPEVRTIKVDRIRLNGPPDNQHTRLVGIDYVFAEWSYDANYPRGNLACAFTQTC